MSQYLLKHVRVEMDRSNYAKKAGLKGTTDIDTSRLISKTNLISWKTKADNLDIVKLKTVPADLTMISNAMNNVVIEKCI